MDGNQRIHVIRLWGFSINVLLPYTLSHILTNQLSHHLLTCQNQSFPVHKIVSKFPKFHFPSLILARQPNPARQPDCLLIYYNGSFPSVISVKLSLTIRLSTIYINEQYRPFNEMVYIGIMFKKKKISQQDKTIRRLLQV